MSKFWKHNYEVRHYSFSLHKQKKIIVQEVTPLIRWDMHIQEGAKLQEKLVSYLISYPISHKGWVTRIGQTNKFFYLRPPNKLMGEWGWLQESTMLVLVHVPYPLWSLVIEQ